jgi:hypothetical protein
MVSACNKRRRRERTISFENISFDNNRRKCRKMSDKRFQGLRSKPK